MSTYENTQPVENEDELERMGDAAERAKDDVEDGARTTADKIHDVVEDAIPGDSDHDGH